MCARRSIGYALSTKMDRAACPECDYTVGLGMASEPGRCPRCGVPLMLTCEFRALSEDELKAEMERQMRMEEQRRKAPL
jgi:uncharacterized paraquat-inducible protein A